MAGAWTIQCNEVSKKFGATLKKSMLYGSKDGISKLIGRSPNSSTLRSGEFWALKNVSFELRQGESLGIMGVNGSGKSTLLRILNETYRPDTGHINIRGRIGALIAAGAGFSPMLSGRENIFVSGALLGLKRQEIIKRFEEIVDFSGIGASIDMPVKHYSSGMYVRLGFAIAATVAPEILLIDEVLAVGDLNFQKKCFDYLLKLKREGCSIIVVSHAPGAIWSLCDRAMLLHKGDLLQLGPTENVIKQYNEINAAQTLKPTAQPVALKADHTGNLGGTGDGVIENPLFTNEAGRPQEIFEHLEAIYFQCDLVIKNRLEFPLFRFTFDAAHYRFIATVDSYEQKFKIDAIEPGHYKLKMKINQPHLMPGTYSINGNVCCKEFYGHIFFWNGMSRFQIKEPKTSFFYSEPSAVVYLQAEYDLQAKQPQAERPLNTES